MENNEKKNVDEPVTVKLSRPVTWGKETVAEIVINPPKAGDIEHLGSNPSMGDILKAVAKSARVPYTLVKELSAKDAFKVSEAFNDFLSDGLETGGNS